MTGFTAENQAKSTSGKNAKMLIQEMLNAMLALDLNIKVGNNYSIGYEGKAKQFKMDFSVCFSDFDNEKWLIKSTNSIRERIYGAEFFAQHIKDIDESVKRILVVVPDSISDKEMKNKRNYAQKTRDKEYVSFLDDVLTVNELQQEIINKASGAITQGVKSNILGSFSEKSVVALLNDERNLILWNDYAGSQQQVKSSTFSYYKGILEAVGLVEGKDRIAKITASDDIPILSNRGAPKTDVSFVAETDTVVISRNISVKNSAEKVVSIHEGNVVDLISALRINESSELASALYQFEECGSVEGEKGLLTKYPGAVEVLTQSLGQYNKEMAEFFLFGVNSPLLTSSEIQVANMILFIEPFAVWVREEYIPHYLSKYQGKGQLGTPFKWTYPSGKRGKKIQIKGYTSSS